VTPDSEPERIPYLITSRLLKNIDDRTRLPEAQHKITLIFIINGQDFPVGASIEARLISAVEIALEVSGNTGRRDPREWEVRDSNGVLLEIDRSIEQLGLKNRSRLFLSLRVGAGGWLLR